MIVVTTPTGNIGRQVVQRLLAAGQEVRVIVRDPASLPSAIRPTVDVVEGSHREESVVQRAFEGADAVFWLCPPVPAPTPEAALVDFTQPAAEAIRQNGIGHVVAVTNLGRDTRWQDRAGMVSASIAMVDLLRQTGAAIRGLALPAFMDNALQQVAGIRDGVIIGMLDPDKKVPHTATEDAAAVAASLLLERSWTGFEDVPVLGPEELSENELAAIVTEVVGHRVRYQQVTPEAFKTQLMSYGLTDAYAESIVAMMRAKNEGMDNIATRTTLRRCPTTFRQWAERHLRPALAG